MRRRLAGLVGGLCGLFLAVGCTPDVADPLGQGQPFGPRARESAPAWPGTAGVEIATSSRWWPMASRRELQSTGIDVVASSASVEGMAVDGAGAVWVDLPWGLVRLDPDTWSESVWDVADDAAFASNWYVHASSGPGVWLVEQDRARLFDGSRFVRDFQVPAQYLQAPGDVERMGWGGAINDLVEVGDELWIASDAGVARCDGWTWRMVGADSPTNVVSLQLTPHGEVWANTGGWGPGSAQRYDGIRWASIDTPGLSGVRATAWDPTGGFVAASDYEVVRYDGSTSQVLLRTGREGIGEAEDIDVEEVAASGDGTVWALAGGELHRLDGDGGWVSIASPDGTPLRGVAASGDEVVVRSEAGVHRVAGDELELIWSQHRGWPVMADIVDVVAASGDQALLVAAEEREDGPVMLSLKWVKVGHPDPVLVGRLPAWAENSYAGFPRSALGAAAVAASDGSIWYATDRSLVRVVDGTEAAVADMPAVDHLVNVNVVAAGHGPGWADDGSREIGPDAFAELTVPGDGVEQTLYADGDIHCPDHWADDRSQPVGRVRYEPTRGAIEITVALTHAWPSTEYYVEVNTDQSCQGGGSAGPWRGDRIWGLRTDAKGAGSLRLTYAPDPGVGLVAGGDGAVWVVPMSWWFADDGPGEPVADAQGRAVCLRAPDGQCIPAPLPAAAKDVTSLVGGADGALWATVCGAGARSEWGLWRCPAGRQLVRWESAWVPAAYPGADVTLLGPAPDGGLWAFLAETSGQEEPGVLAHYGEGRWTTFPDLTTEPADAYYALDDYAVTPSGGVCTIDGSGPTLVCVDSSLRVSRTPVGVEGRVAVAADGTVWLWSGGWLGRSSIAAP